MPNARENKQSQMGRTDLCLYQRMVFWLLVGTQFLLVICLIFLQPSPRQQFFPLLLHVGGIAIGAWALVTMGRRNLNISPVVRESAKLVERGPYRLVRHPMYSALLLFSLSYVVAEISTSSVLLWFGLLLVLVVKSLYEESLLTRRFPDYVEYKKRTWRFIPYVV